MRRLFLSLLLLCSCGDYKDHVVVEIQHVEDGPATCQELNGIASQACVRWVERWTLTGDKYLACRIFIEADDYYLRYPSLLGHELRHCFEGHHHQEGGK